MGMEGGQTFNSNQSVQTRTQKLLISNQSDAERTFVVRADWLIKLAWETD